MYVMAIVRELKSKVLGFYYRIKLALGGYKLVGIKSNIIYGVNREREWKVWFGYGIHMFAYGEYDNSNEAYFAVEILLKGEGRNVN